MSLREMMSDLMSEQKSRIAKLEAENARLRAALRPFADLWNSDTPINLGHILDAASAYSGNLEKCEDQD